MNFQPRKHNDKSGEYVHNLPILREQETIDLIFSLTEGLGFICGGFARYCISQSKIPIVPNDIDIFCETEEVYEKIASLFEKANNVKKGRKTKIETKYKIQLGNKTGFHQEYYGVQLIKPTQIMNMISVGDVYTILDNFDFTIARCAILPDNKTVAHVSFMAHELMKTLVITNIHCPISSLKRVIKYCQKGYTVESFELLKLFIDYENRSTEWKKTIANGLGENQLNEEEIQKFLELMYFD